MKKSEEDDLTDLFCDICKKDFKTKSGMRIHLENLHGIKKEYSCGTCGKILKTEKSKDKHMEKIHGVQHQLPGIGCNLCEKVFLFENELNEHIEKAHEMKEKLNCRKCKFTFEEESVLNNHIEVCGVDGQKEKLDLIHLKCDYCDLKVWGETQAESRKELTKHYGKCDNKPEFFDVSNTYSCGKCEFSTKDESSLKRHRRDKHDETTISTSPKHKKQKHVSFEGSMEIDDQTQHDSVESNDMEVDEPTSILNERSKMWDEKIKKKNEKQEEEERKLLEEKKEKERKEKLQKEKEKKDAVKMKKVRSKMKNKTIRTNANDFQSKPYLRELPKNIKSVFGDDFSLYPVDGDGACGLRAAAGWIFQDPSLGPYLGRNLNTHFVENWHYWKTFFTFPFEREIGFQGKRTFKNETELFNFFNNSEAGGFMWRDHEDFAAISNIYQIKIRIVTVLNVMDTEPVITIQEPDPEFDIVGAEFPPGKLPEMILYHVKDTHYDLIVPKKSKIAEEGGLDYQRVKNLKNKEKYPVEDEKMDVLDEEKTVLETKITKLEEELKTMVERVRVLEAEKQEYLKRSKEDTSFKCYECDEIFYTKTSAMAHMVNHVKEKESNLQEQEGNRILCTKCGEVFPSNEAKETHMKTHIDETVFKCNECDEEFNRKNEFEKHFEKNHKRSNERKMRIRQYNCDDCPFQGDNYSELKKHLERSQHRPSEQREICYTCENEFQGYFQLMNHRKIEHPSNKICRYFKKNSCLFDKNDCWYKHPSEEEVLKQSKQDELPCKDCDQTFNEQKELREHMKLNHVGSVRKCRYYENGCCERSNAKFWFIHEEQTKQANLASSKVVNDEQVFPKVQENLPPDQFKQIMEMITKLSIKVKNLEEK